MEDSAISLTLQFPREISAGRIDSVSRGILGGISKNDERAVVAFIITLFEVLSGGKCDIRLFNADSDSMGGLKVDLILGNTSSTLEFHYSQSIDDDWQNVDINECSCRSSLPHGMTLSLEAFMVSSGTVRLRLDGTDASVLPAIITLGREYFQEVIAGNTYTREKLKHISTAG